MKKVTKILGDVAVAVGCCIGVGFLSGKEAQVFFGNKINVAIFAVAFFAITYAVREYCRKQSCLTIGELSGSLFGKHSTLFNICISLCAFVCIVTVLAGVEQCVSQLFYVSKLPLYAFATAVISAILLKLGLKALKITNALAVVMAIILIIVLLCTSKGQNTENLQVPFYQPIVYALFSVTMSLGVITQLASESTKKENLIASLIASGVLAAFLIALLPLCDMTLNLPTIGKISHPMLIFYTIITLLLSAVTGIVANALPILQQLNSVTQDETLNCALIFLAALAFSMFGFDFAVKFGYLFVSVVGVVILVSTLTKRTQLIKK
ncbi:MAG: hypothetical protein J1F65_01570 [Clostridiales bacterium]|nr:hypothetical protein [Clostridiales bacterium]